LIILFLVSDVFIVDIELAELTADWLKSLPIDLVAQL